ncbi:MAG: PAS domain S-box protein [Promethearchaeota archaeon]
MERILHLAEDMIFKVDLSGRFFFVNDSMVNILGYNREELIGRTGIELIHPEDRPGIKSFLLNPKQLKEIHQFEKRFLLKSGGFIWVQINLTFETNEKGEDVGIIGVARDITEEKQIKEGLQKQRDEAQQYLDLAGVIFVATDASGLVTLINRKGCEVLGYPEEEILGRNWFENFVPENIREVIISVSKQLLRGEIEPAEYFENPILTKDGKERLIAWHNTLIKDEFGKIIGHLSSGEDITEKKKLELALIESEKRYRSFFTNTALGIVIMEKSGKILQWNDALLKMFGIEHFTGGFTLDSYVNLDDRRKMLETLKEKGKLVNYEIQYKKHQGKPFWAALSVDSIKFDEKEFFQSTLIDITEKKEMETALIESEKRYRSFFTNTALAIAVSNRNGDIFEMNETFKKMLGISNIKGVKAQDFYVNLEQRQEILELLRTKGKVENFEVQKKNLQGIPFWVSMSMQPIKYGEQEGLLTTIINITEQKNAENELKQSEENYRSLIENIPDVVWKIRADGKLLYISPNVSKVFGYSPEEFLENKISWPDIVHPDDRLIGDESFSLLFSVNKAFNLTYRVIQKNGTVVWVHDRSIRSYEHQGEIIADGLISNITEQKKAEEALIESEKRYRSFFTNTALAIGITDRYGNILELNDTLKCQLGISDIKGVNVGKLCMSSRQWQEIVDLIRNKGKVENHEMQLKNIQGIPYWASVSIQPIKFGEQQAYITTQINITEQKIAEDKLIQSEEKFRSLIENIPDVVWKIRSDGRILYISPNVLKIFGYTPQEFVEERISWDDIVHPDDKQTSQESLKQLFSHNIPFDKKYRAFNRDGTLVWVHNRSISSYEQNGIIIADGVISDITEQKKMEEERIRTQKLDSISLLAGGIAHDFNNILVGILGNVNLMQLDEQLTDDLKELLQDIEKATIRANDLTKQLLTFSKGGSPIKETASIEKIITESVSFIMHGRKSKCITEFEDDLPAVNVDVGQISQVINNLVINADQAITTGGIITIKASTFQMLNEPDIPLQNGLYIKVSIHDHGKGILPEHQDKIFEPYFTTKSKGSGLGLATCYSILKRHDGYITFNSEMNVGTTFELYLPSTQKKFTPKSKLEFSTKHLKEKVLLMDDDPLIHRTLKKMLGFMGIQMDSSWEGKEAIEKYSMAYQSDSPYSCLIVDLTVPGGWGGKETVAHLKEKYPDLRAFVSSGYSNDPIIANYKDYGFQGVLNKPYSMDQIKKIFQ